MTTEKSRKKRQPWQLTVLRSARITPHMQRITFGGEGLTDFPVGMESAYLKLAFPDAAPRSYTIRRFDSSTREMDIDFVVHEATGPGSGWALSATAGDVIEAGGPGPAKRLKLSGDWCLVVGDMSSLPAIAANLEMLPATVSGYAVIELLDAADQQSFELPEGFSLHWIVNPEPTRSADVMLSAVSALPWIDGQCEAWVASELGTVQAIRSWLKNERGLSREFMYASSYWQLGSTDEQHRVAKARDQQVEEPAG